MLCSSFTECLCSMPCTVTESSRDLSENPSPDKANVNLVPVPAPKLKQLMALFSHAHHEQQVHRATTSQCDSDECCRSAMAVAFLFPFNPQFCDRGDMRRSSCPSDFDGVTDISCHASSVIFRKSSQDSQRIGNVFTTTD